MKKKNNLETFATKQDLMESQKVFESRLYDVRDELRGELYSVRNELQEDIGFVKESVQSLMVGMDVVIKKLDFSNVEGSARNIQLARHDQKITELANHTGYTFND